MAMTSSFSHAAPFIRERLCRAVNKAENARTQRDRRAGFAEAHGLASALNILRHSGDYTFTDGIADQEALPPNALEQTIRFLGGNAHELLGIPRPREKTFRCVFCRGEIEPAECSWCGAPLTQHDENGDLLGEAACQNDDEGHTDTGRRFWVHARPVDREHPRRCDTLRSIRGEPYQGDYATTQGEFAASFKMPEIPAVKR
jgi:hypothetical protein